MYLSGSIGQLILASSRDTIYSGISGFFRLSDRVLIGGASTAWSLSTNSGDSWSLRIDILTCGGRSRPAQD
jgi:hypothetical protein